jgi:predicted N-acetyltransferase YhbS
MLSIRPAPVKSRPSFTLLPEHPPELTQIVPLATIAADHVEALLDAAFGADRFGRTAYKLRAGTRALPDLSFAALDEDGNLIGTLQSWPVRLNRPDGGHDPLTLVGPVAVAPKLQRGGMGKAMMQALLEAADAGATDAMVMIGDPEYYERFFGFSADATGGWDLPGPFEKHRLLARVRRPGGVGRAGMIGPDV